jgi:FkbM family methyltransferase
MNPIRRLAAVLPETAQLELKRIHYAWQLRRNEFLSPEPEYAVLDQYVRPGDWVIDVGANVGHYTKRMSDLVGNAGRVLAFEPMPATFAILAGNVQRFKYANVSLFNAAISDRSALVAMELPKYGDGLNNYYQAHLTTEASGGLRVAAYPLDVFQMGARIALIKIDAEGHEEAVIAGMLGLIERDRPTLIVETGKLAVIEGFRGRGYEPKSLPGSPNVLFIADSRGS